jgi:hypothetical protein
MRRINGFFCVFAFVASTAHNDDIHDDDDDTDARTKVCVKAAIKRIQCNKSMYTVSLLPLIVVLMTFAISGLRYFSIGHEVEKC